MGTISLTFLGIGSLVLMVLGLVLMQHHDSSDPNHYIWGWVCDGWIGALCLTAGWFFSSAFRNYDEVKWPKWPFVGAHKLRY